MGTWGVRIAQNDTFCEVQEKFEEMLNDGFEPSQIANKLMHEYITSPEKNNAVYAIADALWHCESIDAEWIRTVEQFIQCGEDTRYWCELGADEDTILKRKSEMKRFLRLIKMPPSKNQVWKQKRLKKVSIRKGDCFWYKSKGKIFGALVADVVENYYLVGISEELNTLTLSVQEILNAQLYTAAWFSDIELLPANRCHVIGVVDVPPNYNGLCGFLAIQDDSITVNNPGQKSTWAHEFCCLRLPGRVVSALLNINTLPKMPRTY